MSSFVEIKLKILYICIKSITEVKRKRENKLKDRN